MFGIKINQIKKIFAILALFALMLNFSFAADVIVESGRLNISDTLTVPSLRTPVGYRTGYVLTSDANGYGIWQTVGGTPLGGCTHSHTMDIPQFNSGSTGSASVDVTMPYIQLTACIKS